MLRNKAILHFLPITLLNDEFIRCSIIQERMHSDIENSIEDFITLLGRIVNSIILQLEYSRVFFVKKSDDKHFFEDMLFILK